MSKDGDTAGTPAYMAPEQAAGHLRKLGYLMSDLAGIYADQSEYDKAEIWLLKANEWRVELERIEDFEE